MVTMTREASRRTNAGPAIREPGMPSGMGSVSYATKRRIHMAFIVRPTYTMAREVSSYYV